MSIVLVALGIYAAAQRETHSAPEEPTSTHDSDCERRPWQLTAHATLECLPVLLASGSLGAAEFARCASALARLVEGCHDAPR
jgi:hypothetical protein